jgi:hypothetical protein
VGNALNIHHFEVERSADGKIFALAGTTAPSSNTTYSLTDISAPNSTGFYRVKAVGISGEIKYSAMVKVAAEIANPGYLVVPNPIEGTEINIQFKNQPGGNYTIRLADNNGKQILSNVVSHIGGNATQTILLPASLSKGTYQLEIISPDKSSSVQTVFVNN